MLGPPNLPAPLVCFKCRGRMREVTRTDASGLRAYNIRCTTEGCYFERPADALEAQMAVRSCPTTA
jgi:ferredoxin